MKSIYCIIVYLFALLILSGCASYVTPGPRAELANLAPPKIREGFERKPSNPFPASIVAVRVQGRDYTNYNHRN